MTKYSNCSKPSRWVLHRAPYQSRSMALGLSEVDDDTVVSLERVRRLWSRFCLELTWGLSASWSAEGPVSSPAHFPAWKCNNDWSCLSGGQFWQHLHSFKCAHPLTSWNLSWRNTQVSARDGMFAATLSNRDLHIHRHKTAWTNSGPFDLGKRCHLGKKQVSKEQSGSITVCHWVKQARFIKKKNSVWYEPIAMFIYV